ncbi:MAG: extracellular solute-binding protein, partial [Acidimicrobiales bacterium]
MKNKPRKERRSLHLVLISMMAVFALIAAACGSDAEDAIDGATDAVENATDEAVDAVDGDDDAMEEDGGAMEEDGDAMAEGGEITVAIVDNGATGNIQELAPMFTAETGITVNFVTLEEQTLREQVTRAAGTGGGQYDAMMIGPYEAPQFGQNEWLVDLAGFADADADYDVDDLMPPIRGALSLGDQMFAVPFYAESSFVMYNKEIMDAAGVTVPNAPTWDEIAEIARTVHSDDVAGICLRGLPGWGDLGASLTTVVNTFGGTWWEANADGTPGEAQINQADSGFREATEFYVNLLNDAGQEDAANSSFPQCLQLMQDEKAAMWYDATVAAGILEGADSPIAGKLDYALAPTKLTEASGWLWTWALAIPQGSDNVDHAWDFISWATSKEFIQLAGTELDGGWAAIPPGSRISTYEIPEYQEAAASFAERTLAAMEAAPIDNPGTTPRPGLPGVQYVNIPEFQDVG